MRKLVIVLALVFVVALVLPAMAGKGNQTYKFNMIGHPNCETLEGAIGGDSSGGKAVMIPLVNAHSVNANGNANENELPELICPDGEYLQDEPVLGVDDPLWYYKDPAKGVKIFFELKNYFEVLDRDACDGEARIYLPGDPSTSSWDMFVRVLGKPNKCLGITGYAYDTAQTLWFCAGSFTFKRKFGQATWIKVDDLFDVLWCQVDQGTNECTGATQELSVFDPKFGNYFWDVLNDGVRLVQVKLVASNSN